MGKEWAVGQLWYEVSKYADPQFGLGVMADRYSSEVYLD